MENQTINELLNQIKSSLLIPNQVRFNYLIARRDASTITVNEYEELLKITNHMEKSDTIRLEKIAKIAELKGISLSETLDFVGISQLPNNH